MEGLRGTAIRLAVRDPSCPQAPVLARAWRLPVRVRGLLLQVAQDTTTVASQAAAAEDVARRVAHQAGIAGRCRDPDLITRDHVLRCSVRVPGSSRASSTVYGEGSRPKR